MKQKPSQHKLGDFLEGKGFYIVLFLCVAAIGISGYFLFSGLFAQPEGFGGENTSAVSGQAEMPQEDAAGQTAGQTTPAPQEDGTAGTSPQEDTSAASTDTGDTQEDSPDEEAAASSGYVWPVEGSVDRDFSLEVFAYDETMGDWRTHEGIDINAQLGAPVSACAKGTVTDVTTDDMMGVTVTVETVVLLSQQKPDDTIEIDLDLDELDATSAELKATYQEIKDYVLKEFGLKVSSLYISQVKRKCGIEVGENYNLPKSENARVPQCPKEKEDAIKAALKYYAMI